MGSSRGSTWRERRKKRHEDREYEHEEEQSGLGEGSYQTNQAASDVSGHRQLDERDEELEQLHRLVRDLELEARDRHRRGDRDNLAAGSMSRGDRFGWGSKQSGSHRHRDRSRSQESRRRRDHSHSRKSHRHRECSRSREYERGSSNSPEKQWPRNAAMDAMSHALQRAA